MLAIYFLFLSLGLSSAVNAEETASTNNEESIIDRLSQATTEKDDKKTFNVATRLAVVKVSILLDQSPRAKALAKSIKKRYLEREQILKREHEDLKKLESQLDRRADKLSNAERIKNSREFRTRKRQYTRDYELFRDQLNSERQEALIRVRQEVLEAITAVRKQYNIDIVIENYISADTTVDITTDVIQYLEKHYQQEQNPSPSSPTKTES
jgi:Skp family chaperone for outer membrane proteins